MKKTFPFLMLVLAVLWMFLHGTVRRLPSEKGVESRSSAAPDPQPAPESSSVPGKSTIPSGPFVSPPSAAAEFDEPASRDAFRDWMRRHALASPPDREASIREGIALGEARRLQFLEWIPATPERALEAALSFSEWEALPAPVRERVERPFSQRVDFRVYPVCGKGGGLARGAEALIDWGNGRQAQAFVCGVRREIGSKRALPVQGIALEGVAAVRAQVFQEVPPKDFEYAVRHFEKARIGLERSFATGASLAGPPVHAVSGGRLYAFKDRAELQSVERMLAAVERAPAPRVSSGLLCSYPAALGDAGELRPAALQAAAAQISREWTTGHKKLFLIRVQFPGGVERPPSQAEIERELNGAVAGDIQSFSSGRASIEAVASGRVYELPQPGSFYSDSASSDYGGSSFSSKNDDLYAAAKTVFEQQKSAGDASISLADFDVVGVSFPEAGCKNAGLKYSGLATLGEGRLWMQGNNTRKVYVHELGHVYGLEHSNFWQVADLAASRAAAVVGRGEEKEYGDIFDVMGDGDAPQGHFHPHAKRRLEWLDVAEVQEVNASGVFQVHRQDGGIAVSGGSGGATSARLRGLRIPKGADESYWLGYRAAYPANPNLSRGAYLLWQLRDAERCCLLDTTPGSAEGKKDAGLRIGRTYSDLSAGVHITPLEKGGESVAQGGGDAWLRVRVEVGDFSTNTAPRAPAGISGPTVCPARTQVQFSLAAEDLEEGAQLAFDWDAGDDSDHSQNGVAASTFRHAWVKGGTYTVRATVSDMKGGVLIREMTVRVEDPVDVLERQTVDAGVDFSGVCANAWLLVAVDESGGIYTSSDGAQWTSRTVANSSLNLKFHAATWSELSRRFFAVGRDWDSDKKLWMGVVYASPNGVDWTRVATVPGESGFEGSALTLVSAGASGIVAAGHSGVVLHSLDGLAWSRLQSRPGLDAGHVVTGLAFGAGTFLLAAHPVEQNSILPDARIFASPDGRTWSEKTDRAVLGGWDHLSRIFFVGERFLADGMDRKLWVSADGGNSFSVALESVQELSAAVYREGLFLASARLGEDGASSTWGRLFSSEGDRWTPSAGASEFLSAGLVFFQDQLLAVGTSGRIWKSAPLGNAVNHPPVVLPVNVPAVWARSAATFSVSAQDPEGNPLRYHWDAGPGTVQNTESTFTHLWAAGGTQTLEVTVSDGLGGSARQRVNIPVQDPLQVFTPVVSGGTQNLRGVAVGGTLLVAVGEGAEIRVSADGAVWKQGSIEKNPNLYFEAVAWGNGRFSAVGRDWDFTAKQWCGVVYASTNGQQWTRVHKAAAGTGVWGSQLRSVAFGNGRWIAVGHGGTVLRSSDGITWTADTLPSLTAAFVVADVTYGEGVFVAVGHQFSNTAQFGSARVWVLPDSGSWQLRSSAAGELESYQDFRMVRYVGNQFVAGGFFSKLRTSSDAGNSFPTTRPEQEEARFAVWMDGAYFVFASDGYLTDSRGVSSANPLPVAVVSSDGQNWSRLTLASDLSGVRAGTVFGGRIYAVGDAGKIWRTESPLRILRQPVSLTVEPGQDATFEVVAMGGGSLTYQWYREQQPVPSADGPFLRVPSVDASVAGGYWVIVSDASGQSLSSARVELALQKEGSLRLLQQPQSLAVLEGEPVTLEVGVESEGPVSYVWRKDGLRIPGGASSVLRLDAARPEHEGWYRVEAGSAQGQLTSREVFVRVWPAGSAPALSGKPWIVRHPRGQVVPAGAPLQLEVEAVLGIPASSGVSYQWLRNGRLLGGQTAGALQIASVVEADGGDYTVQVSSSGGSVLSLPARVSVIAVPGPASVFWRSPLLGGARFAGDNFTLSAELGGAVVSRQWYRGGVPIPGATGTELVLTNQREIGSHLYQLWAADASGKAVLSEPVEVQTRDFSAWKGSFQGLLRDAAGRVHGRATVNISRFGTVSCTLQWRRGVFRGAGGLRSDLSMEGSLPPAFVENAVYRLECDAETGSIHLRLRQGSVDFAYALDCGRGWELLAKHSRALPEGGGLLLESAEESQSGPFANVGAPLGAVQLRRGAVPVLWGFGRLASGGVWTASALCLKEEPEAAFFAKVARTTQVSAGWMGGSISLASPAVPGHRFDWSQPPENAGDFPGGWDLRLAAEPVWVSPESVQAALIKAGASAWVLSAQRPDGTPETASLQWTPGGFRASQTNDAPFFASLRLGIHWQRGLVEGSCGDTLSAARYAWTGLFLPAESGAGVRVRGFVRGGTWVAPFQIEMPAASRSSGATTAPPSSP